MFPLIPLLAIAAIVGGVATLTWYSNLSKDEQKHADTLAMQWFGKRFQQLAEHQKKQIKDSMNG
jgi:hypothetical protein